MPRNSRRQYESYKSAASTMDFFEHQDSAKSRTRRFVLLYTIAVIIMIASIAAVAAIVVTTTSNTPPEQATQTAVLAATIAALITAVLITGGALYRIAELRGGGSSVALALGGQQIDPSTRVANERQLLNIVEEMALASGVPVPPVYIMPNQRGINAFAAGYSPSDAVVAVTQGCLDGLKRDELQGVIAHEFSHILNGDMRLNIRMIGLLNGILLLTLIGQLILRTMFHTGTTRSRNNKGNNATLPILAVALAFLIVGSLGALAARIIQASVSRQREFLADASAVQFTRNPTGIANALRRLGAKPKSTKIDHPRAQESNHMFFAESYSSLSSNLAPSSLLASHPPLEERIRRIDPSWDGTMLEPLLPPVHPAHDDQGLKNRSVESARDRLQQLTNPSATDSPLAQANALIPLLALSGTMTPAHIDHARTIIQALPDKLKDAARDISSSRAVIYALLLDRKDPTIRDAQIASLKQHADPAIAKLTESLAQTAITLSPDLRLPLLDMTLAALAHLSDKQHTTFRANVKALIELDRTIDLFEWVTTNTLTRHLDQRFGLAQPPVTQYYNLRQLGIELSTLLTALARAGSPDKQAIQSAFTLGATALSNATHPSRPLLLLPKDQATLSDLNDALTTLNTCAPKLKRDILKACALTAGADRLITTTESELLRAIADALAVPTPPLLPNQQLA